MKRYFGWAWFYVMCLIGAFLLAGLLCGMYGNPAVIVLVIAGLGFSAWKGGWQLAHPKKGGRKR